MNLYTRYLRSALMLIALFSCTRNPANENPDPEKNLVTISFSGRVTNELGEPAQHISVRAGDNETETDANGDFYFRDVAVEENNSYLEVNAPGYFKTGSTINTGKSSGGYMEIRLVKREKRGGFEASAGGNIAVDDASLQLPANAYVIYGGSDPYTGAVSVYASYISQSALKNAPLRPGNSSITGDSGQLQVFNSYGMLAVELEGANGERLNIEGGKASISMPAPAGAPDELPLWHLDETSNIWKQEGSVSRQADKYIGEVAHFSWWSADELEEMVNIRIAYQNQSDKPFALCRVLLTDSIDSSAVTFTTDSLGVLNASVPKGRAFSLRLLTRCSPPLNVVSFPALTEDTDLGIQKINGNPASITALSGTVTDCAGNPLVNAYVRIYTKANFVTAITDNYGRYVQQWFTCRDTSVTAMIIGIDPKTRQQSSSAVFQELVPGVNNVAGLIQACGTSTEEFIRFNINGRSVSFNAPGQPSTLYAEKSDTTTFIHAEQLKRSQQTDFYFSTYPSPDRPYIMHRMRLALTPDSVLLANVHNIDLTITEDGEPGQFTAGSFEAEAHYEGHPGTVNVSCTFRVRRRPSRY